MTPAQGSGRERRRFPRYDIEIAVKTKRKTGEVRMVTGDVSRHGAFIKTDQPAALRQLVQLTFVLPEVGPIDAMCMVARILPADGARPAGMGVDFFALSKEAKQRWERFVGDLRARRSADGLDTAHSTLGNVALPPGLGVPAPAHGSAPSGMPEWMGTNSLTGQIVVRDAARTAGVPLPPGVVPSSSSSSSSSSSLPPSPSSSGQDAMMGALPFLDLESGPPSAQPWQPPPPPPDDDAEAGQSDDGASVSMAGSVLILRMSNVEALQAFVSNEVERGGLFMKTPLSKELGDKVDVVLVHPDTDDEFHLEGTVVRRVITGPVDQRGLGIFFKALPPDAKQKLQDFVDSGIEVVELGQIVSDRQMELEAAVAREPDSAEALEALGSYFLDEEGDLGGALTALTRALVLGPSQISIHASLARAYRKIGDQVKVRAHERVAEALMLFQDKLKVRMGVGSDDLL